MRYEEKSLIEEHKAQAIYAALRFRATDGWLFDDPAFKELSAAVRGFEDLERQGCTDTFSTSRQKSVNATAQAVTHSLQPTLLAIATTAAVAQETQATHHAQVMQQLSTVAAAAAVDRAAITTVVAVDRYDRGEGNLRSLSAAQLEAAEQLRSSRGFPPIRGSGQRLPPQPPAPFLSLPPVTTATFAAAAPSAAFAAAPSAAFAAVAAPSAKRKRQADGPGLRQVGFAALIDIRELWVEYVGQEGVLGLRRREEETPRWKEGNKQASNMYYDKLFFYREIAKQAGALGGDVDLAVEATQARLDQHRSNRSPGWSKLQKELAGEQPQGGSVRAKLTAMLRQLVV